MTVSTRWIGALGAAAAVALTAASGRAQATITVAPDGPVRTIAAALQMVAPGGRIVVQRGVYREPTITVARPVTITGQPGATLDGQGARQIMTVTADDVTITGLHFEHVGTSFVEDRAALKVIRAHRCVIADNRIDDAMFGIYLAEVTDCRVERNVLHASTVGEAASGNGIHLWSSRRITIAGTRISGHRDGIYFEFVHDSDIHDNLSERNLRYGLHFMYSDDCRYRRNVFRHNGSGVAVMYTRRVEMVGNRFEGNWGSASYGLLLKEIADSRLEHNVFAHNTTGLLADAADRLIADRNDFIGNGWAVKVEASTQDGRFTRNNFVGNTFDVATNSGTLSTTFTGNYWDGYDGYDLNHDGAGDVPYAPVRFFSLVVSRNEPALVLLRSPLVGLLDAAERALPAFTPVAVVDAHPHMHRYP